MWHCDSCQNPTPLPIQYGSLKICELRKQRKRLTKLRVRHRLKRNREQTKKA